MTDADRLQVVRVLHAAIYLTMSWACFAVLYAGIWGRGGLWLTVALVLVAIETVVFVGSGMKCPLTAVAVRYGATKDGAYDTLFPEACTRYTLTVFGPLIIIGLGLNAGRWLGWL